MTARLRSLPAMFLCSLRLFPLAALLLLGPGPLKAQTRADWDPLEIGIAAENRTDLLPKLASPRLDRPWDQAPFHEGLPTLPPGHDTTLLAPRLRTRSLHFEKGLPPTLEVDQPALEEINIGDDFNPEIDPRSAAERVRRQLQKEDYEAFREDVKYPDKGKDREEEAASKDEKAPPGRNGQPKSAELYLQGHLMMKEGHDLEKQSDFSGAYFKFKEARDLFDQAHELDRAWQPEIVEYRRRKIREDLERVRQAEVRHRAGQGAASPASPDAENKPSDQPGPHFDPDNVVRRQQPPEKGPSDRPLAKRSRKHQGAGPADGQDLRRRLHQAEAALQESRRREEALRTVVRDLIQQMDAPERRLPGFRLPPLQPPFPPLPPSSSPPPPSPVPPSPAP